MVPLLPPPYSLLGAVTVDVVQGVKGLLRFVPDDMHEGFLSLVSGGVMHCCILLRCFLVLRVGVLVPSW